MIDDVVRIPERVIEGGGPLACYNFDARDLCTFRDSTAAADRI